MFLAVLSYVLLVFRVFILLGLLHGGIYRVCGPDGLTLRLLMSYIYMEHQFLMFLDHTQRRTTVGRTPLDEWSVRRTDLYLTKHDTHNRQISMPPVGFEPTISAGERPQADHLQHSTTVRSAHTVFMSFIFIWEQTATCATYSINWLVFQAEMKSVYSAVRTGSLNKAVCIFVLISYWSRDTPTV